MTEPRRFHLQRDTDITGASGTGRVADGVLWPDGTTTLRWRGPRASTVHWDRLADAKAIHGHGGHTRIVWDDPEPAADLYLGASGCPHCPDGHTPADRGSQPWAAWLSPERDGDGQPTTIHVARSAGAHVAESDAEWVRHRLNGPPSDPKPDHTPPVHVIRTGTATRPGSRGDLADAAHIYHLADGTIGAAVIDGIGHGPHTSRVAPILASVAARITARRSPLAGLLTAADLVADAGADGHEADAVAVVAQISAEGARIAWVGDCRAYTCDGTSLTQHSTDQTMGQWVRIHKDVPVEIAEHHDAWVRVQLSTATVATTRETDLPATARLVLLTSDGVHDQMPGERMAALVREHVDDPQALADALVAAAEDEGGYRDDATAIVIAL
ncbi:hypothetical protein [Streptomyces qinglanensis]|uniref:hypothetical protein n=1 Tax=Streptomyces qinglanensis TaxID=943816 RepID=UPI003D72ECF6